MVASASAGMVHTPSVYVVIIMMSIHHIDPAGARRFIGFAAGKNGKRGRTARKNEWQNLVFRPQKPPEKIFTPLIGEVQNHTTLTGNHELKPVRIPFRCIPILHFTDFSDLRSLRYKFRGIPNLCYL